MREMHCNSICCRQDVCPGSGQQGVQAAGSSRSTRSHSQAEKQRKQKNERKKYRAALRVILKGGAFLGWCMTMIHTLVGRLGETGTFKQTNLGWQCQNIDSPPAELREQTQTSSLHLPRKLRRGLLPLAAAARKHEVAAGVYLQNVQQQQLRGRLGQVASRGAAVHRSQAALQGAGGGAGAVAQHHCCRPGCQGGGGRQEGMQARTSALCS